MRLLKPLAIAGIGLLAACNQNGEAMSFDGDVRHENGLTVSRPAGFSETKTGSGFAFTENGDMRSPRTITVETVTAQPALTDAKRKTLGGADVAYAVTDIGSGSGGTEYELQAVKAAARGWIVLKATEQTEGGEPAFTAGWAVLETATVAQ